MNTKYALIVYKRNKSNYAPHTLHEPSYTYQVVVKEDNYIDRYGPREYSIKKAMNEARKVLDPRLSLYTYGLKRLKVIPLHNLNYYYHLRKYPELFI